MRKEFNTMLIMVVSAILGVVCAIILGQLNTQGYVSGLLIGGITIDQLQFLVFFIWLIGGMAAGILKN
jgi:ABC-type thiamin/hydroxymethylpyrimidine transport system permease subunit